jgi:hypothetical protein
MFQPNIASMRGARMSKTQAPDIDEIASGNVITSAAAAAAKVRRR